MIDLEQFASGTKAAYYLARIAEFVLAHIGRRRGQK